ncbi:MULTISPECIES: LacI family DNA-binding transcriptional regulator [unclassified Cryobacterium]|uniref:LacI family DNA-binding transcriptional regulator n=1 Tax=unclassified Cryobacterium TaxID=2649013 RepID=UPI002AB4DA01|nr:MULTISPECIES: LacI family DNA-binding transcriptional regulator [unclassified Cryobacterium]MDY7542297.1 LacI family DNA-binding transcriptional regulator [Cryobacterium sp. 5B3]MEB0000283.1 LacI family DNA-binding transcriptional regulator [Cryobacterium sp. RTS3]MEB0267555.1 LacI family DNA-binding transcriptional regulator [Cryobacterium sp. 10I5]MEB0275804.1 LacI family DNA-binding transcriptional regulator [Cryobacterium sp. 5B3]
MVTITIKDVAALAGVSVATTSRVLSGNPATSADARSRVHAAVAELDYRPNAQARALRSTRTHAIGLLVPDVRNPFFADLAHTVEQAALVHGFVTLLGNANERKDQQDRYLDNLIARRVDGIIVAPLGDGSGSIRSVVGREIPAVFIDRTIEGIDLPSVTTDSDTGIREAVDHLAALGHTRIGYIAGPQSTSTGRERYASFVRAAGDRGLSLDPALIVFGDFQPESGSAAVRTLLALTEPPTALLVADSPMAFGAIGAIQELGLRIGTDVALVSFDDIDWLALLDPPVSVIAHSVADMGRIAVEMLRTVIDGGRPESVRLPSRLVVRASSATPVDPSRSR